MKAVFSMILCFLCMSTFGQPAMQEWPLSNVEKGAREIIQKSPRGNITRYVYDKDGFLIRQFYKSRGKVRTHKIIDYEKSDTVLIVRENEILNEYKKNEDYDKSVRKFFFDNEGKYRRFEVYTLEKETEPFVIGDNFVYEGDLLISYDRSKHFRNGDILTTRIINRYNDKGQLIRTHFSEPDSNLDTFIIYQYNEQGQLTDRIKVIPDYMGILDISSLLGEEFSRGQRMSKRQTSYSGFDTKNKWTVNYSIQKDGKKKAGYKRKIEYY